MVITAFISSIFFLYFIVVYWITKFWPSIETNTKIKTLAFTATVVITVKNEEENILKCLNSILDQSKRDFSIIVVNDHSTDKTEEIVRNLGDKRIDCINLPPDLSGKKAGITYGIEQTNSDWIITVDGDIRFGPYWLESIARYADQADCMVAPVSFESEPGLFYSFQYWDLLAMQGFTKAGIDSNQYFMGNGANLIFKKSWFESVNGYEGNRKIPSGDDYFLLDKFRVDNSEKIKYLADVKAIGFTEPCNTIREFIAQRIRWSGKMSALKLGKIQAIQAMIWLANFSWLCALCFAIFTLSDQFYLWILLGAKVALDYIFLNKIGRFFGARLSIYEYARILFLHNIYLVVIGLISLLPIRVAWKGRKL